VGFLVDVIFRLQDQEFEWDAEKAATNQEKHGVTFEEAAEVFFDPFVQFGDATPDGVDETRDYALGYSLTQRLVLVVHTERATRYRLISARPATRKERNLYESE
jgi:uncharacterized DUF497 family protein